MSSNYSTAILLASLLLSSCSIFPSYEPVESYTIVPTVQESKDCDVLSHTILVDRPTMDTFTDSDQIPVFFDDSKRRDYLSNAKFDDNIADKIQSLTIQHFNKRQHFAGVGRVDSGMVADYMIQITLNDFSLHYDNQGKAYIKLSGFMNLLDMKTRKPGYAKPLDYNYPLPENNITHVMDGFGEVTGLMINDVLQIVYYDLKSKDNHN